MGYFNALTFACMTLSVPGFFKFMLGPIIISSNAYETVRLKEPDLGWHQGALLLIWINFNPRLSLIPTWINNHIPSKAWDEITSPFPNFNGCTVQVTEWISNFKPHFIIDVILLIHVGLKLIHVNEWGPRWVKSSYYPTHCVNIIVTS